MAKDFINSIQKISGVKASPLATEANGIYHDITVKTTNDDGSVRSGNGIYGSIKNISTTVEGMETHIEEIVEGLDVIVGDIFDEGGMSDKLEQMNDLFQDIAGEDGTGNTEGMYKEVVDNTAITNANVITTNADAITSTTGADIATSKAIEVSDSATATAADAVQTADDRLVTEANALTTTNKALEASNSASSASDSEAVAITQASIATTQATSASEDAVIASDSAGVTVTKATEASNSASEALVSEGKTADDVLVTNADRVVTTSDREATNSDAAQTALDRIQTTADVQNTADDVIQTNTDASNTADDVITTNADAVSTAADRVSVSEDTTTTADNTVIVTTKTQEASNSASDALTAKNEAVSAKDITVIAKDDAEFALVAFEVNYLGAKTTEPTTDNEGEVLSDGAFYYNTTSSPKELRIWNGTEFVSAVFDATGAVLTFNGRDGSVTLNVADVNDVIGFDIATALVDGDVGVTVQGYNADTVIDSSYVATENSYTTVEKTKLGNIEDSATGDQTGAEIKLSYEGESNTNAFTDVLKSKLDDIESSATADQTASEIEGLYESVADTNKYTDSEKSKLSGVEISAEVNRTATETSLLMKDYTESLTGKTLTDPSNHIHAHRIEFNVKASVDIAKGTPVTINEWNATDNVAEAVITDQATMIANAIAAEDILSDAVGVVVMSGRITGLNTEDYAENQVLYVGNGVLAEDEPTTGHSQPVVKVLRDHVSDGVVQVQIHAPRQTADTTRYGTTTSIKDKIEDIITSAILVGEEDV